MDEGRGSRIRYLTWWNLPRRVWILILGELFIILYFVGWFYLEYVNNKFLQDYLNSLSPILFPVLSIAFGATAATIATIFYLGVRRVRAAQEPEKPARRSQDRRSAKRTRSPTRPRQRTTRKDQPPPGVPKPMFIITSPKRVEAQNAQVEKKEPKPTPDKAQNTNTK